MDKIGPTGSASRSCKLQLVLYLPADGLRKRPGVDALLLPQSMDFGHFSVEPNRFPFSSFSCTVWNFDKREHVGAS